MVIIALVVSALTLQQISTQQTLEHRLVQAHELAAQSMSTNDRTSLATRYERAFSSYVEALSELARETRSSASHALANDLQATFGGIRPRRLSEGDGDGDGDGSSCPVCAACPPSAPDPPSAPPDPPTPPMPPSTPPMPPPSPTQAGMWVSLSVVASILGPTLLIMIILSFE